MTVDDLAARYVAVWNEQDPTARRTAVEALFAPDARYTDPLADVTGTGALDSLIFGVQQQFPGWSFRPAGPADGHHSQVRFSWALGPGDEPSDAPVLGFDVVTLDDDGRIVRVLGFLDRVPA